MGGSNQCAPLNKFGDYSEATDTESSLCTLTLNLGPLRDKALGEAEKNSYRFLCLCSIASGFGSAVCPGLEEGVRFDRRGGSKRGL